MIREVCSRKKTIDLNANSLSPDRMKRLFFRGKHAAVAVPVASLGQKRKTGKQELNDAKCAPRLPA